MVISATRSEVLASTLEPAPSVSRMGRMANHNLHTGPLFLWHLSPLRSPHPPLPRPLHLSLASFSDRDPDEG